MTRETGNGKTPQKVVDELNKKLLETSLNAISKATGVGVSALHRYQRGIGEPTTATLNKLAPYFGKSVMYLRSGHLTEPWGEWHEHFELELKELKDMAELYRITPEHLKRTLARIIEAGKFNIVDYMERFVGNNLSEKDVKDIENLLSEINKYCPEDSK